MQSLTSLVGRLAAVLSCAVALGACNRAEYATLPKSPAYLGTKSVVSAPRPAALAPAAAPAAEVAPVPAAPAPAAPVATAPTVSTPAVATAPAVVSAPAVTAPVASAPAKLNLVQRLALAKVAKKMNKLAAKSPQFKQRDAAASTARIDGNLRTGIILIVIGLIVGIFSGLLGTIIALIGVLFLVLWLLDAL